MSPFIRRPAVRHADRWTARSVILFLLALFTATQVTQPDVLDGEVEFQTASALARTGSFALGGTPEAEMIKAAEFPDGQGGVRRGFNGRWGGPGREAEFFSWFGVGQAFVGVPLYVAGSWIGELVPEYEERNAETTHMGVSRSEYFAHLLVGWRNPLLTALTAGLIVLSSRRLGASRRSAWIAGLTYGLTTYAWPQARSTLNSVQATFWIFLAFHLVLVFEEALDRHRRPGKFALLLCGASLGAAFLTRSLTAPVLLVVSVSAVFVLLRGYRKLAMRMAAVDLMWIALPALGAIGVFLMTNKARFGDPLEQGYGGVVTLEGYFNYPLHFGLAGILLSPGQGLFWMAPGSVLALVWCFHLLRKRSYRMPLLLLGIAAAVLVPVCLTVGWHGAWGYGPRYALPLLPFLWLAVGPVLDMVSDVVVQRALVHALFVIGFLVALPGALVDTTTHTDLAVQAARLEWPNVEGNLQDQEEERFQRIHWTLRFAAPGAHWRILRHRVAGLGEAFPADKIYSVPRERAPDPLVPQHEREKGFSHLAWYDFHHRLGGPLWPLGLACTLFVLAGVVFAVRGMDPNRA